MIDPASTTAIRAWLSAGDSIDIRVKSTSMWPLIRTNDRVRIVPLGTHGVRWGDIVLIQLGDRRLVHRVRGINPSLRTQGDVAPAEDVPAATVTVLGRVGAIERGGHWYRLPPGELNKPLAVLALATAKIAMRRWASKRAV